MFHSVFCVALSQPFPLSAAVSSTKPRQELLMVSKHSFSGRKNFKPHLYVTPFEFSEQKFNGNTAGTGS